MEVTYYTCIWQKWGVLSVKISLSSPHNPIDSFSSVRLMCTEHKSQMIRRQTDSQSRDSNLIPTLILTCLQSNFRIISAFFLTFLQVSAAENGPLGHRAVSTLSSAVLTRRTPPSARTPPFWPARRKRQIHRECPFTTPSTQHPLSIQ